MPTAGLEPKYAFLQQTDAVAPVVIHGTHSIPLALPPGSLLEEKDSTPQEVHDALRRDGLPVWMSEYREDIVGETRRAFAALHYLGPGDHGTYAFDLSCRLDDRTFVGAPVGNDLPLLSVRMAPDVIGDSSGETFAARLRGYVRGDQQYMGDFSIEMRPFAGVAPALAHHVPTLFLVETVRVVSAFRDLQLGDPAGTVTLTPGEDRKFTVKSASALTATDKVSSSVVESSTEEATDSFSEEFDRQDERTSNSGGEISWSNSSESGSPAAGSSASSATTQKQTYSLQDVASLTSKTVRSVASRRSRTATVSLSREYEKVTTESTETDRTVELVNKTDQALTYVFYHLVARYRVDVDLAGIRLFFNGSSVADRGTSVALTDRLRSGLASILVPGADVDAVLKLVVQALQDRYASQQLGKATPDGFALEKPAESDVNSALYSRAALTGARRRTGALPLELVAEDHVIQTSGVHAVPYLSESFVPAAPT